MTARKHQGKVISGAALIRKLNAELPIIDITDLSWADTKFMSIVRMRLNNAVAQNDEDKLEQSMNDMQVFLTRIVSDVPRSWLVSSAPDDIDWSDPTSFDLLRNDRMNDLLTLVNDETTPEGASKN